MMKANSEPLKYVLLYDFIFVVVFRHHSKSIPVHRFRKDIDVVRLGTESVQERRLARADVALHGHSERLPAPEINRRW